MQEKTGNRAVDSDTAALYVVIDFNTRNAANNCMQIFGTSTHARNKHLQNWERSMSVAPSGYESNLMHMKLLDRAISSHKKPSSFPIRHFGDDGTE